MSYHKIAKNVAKTYIDTHADADEEFIYLICQDAAAQYDTSGSALSVEAYITLRMRSAISTARGRPSGTNNQGTSSKSAHNPDVTRESVRDTSECSVEERGTDERHTAPITQISDTVPHAETIDESVAPSAVIEEIEPQEEPAEIPELLEDSVDTALSSESNQGITSDTAKTVSPVQEITVEDDCQPLESCESSVDKKEIDREVEKNMAKEYSRRSAEELTAIREDIAAGLDPVEVADKYSMPIKTLRSNISNWRRRGLLPSEAKAISDTPISAPLTFATAAQDPVHFIEAQLAQAELVSIHADNAIQTVSLCYKTPSNRVLELSIRVSESKEEE